MPKPDETTKSSALLPPPGWKKPVALPGSIKPINETALFRSPSCNSTVAVDDRLILIPYNLVGCADPAKMPLKSGSGRSGPGSTVAAKNGASKLTRGIRSSVATSFQSAPQAAADSGSSAHHAHVKKDDANFANFEASVSDAWSMDDYSINPSMAQISAEAVIHKSNMLLNSTPHNRLARAHALQRLATQKEPLPSISNLPPVTSHQQTSIYPKLAEFANETSTSRGNIVDIITAEEVRLKKIEKLLNAPSIDLDDLKRECWKGVPHKLRPIVWRIISGYLPPNKQNMERVLKKKRDDYFDFVQQYYHTRHQEQHQDTFRQIHIDIPRMCPLMPLFQQQVVQEMFERILFIWAIRNPASGYVQGINDLVTPYFVVFLSEYVDAGREVGSTLVADLPREQREAIEADSFWCVKLLLDTVHENYTFAQPGIQLKVRMLEHLVQRVDNQLHQHLKTHQLEYLQFAFRWMNNLLMREIPLRATIRLWDTYLSENNGFADFHVYVCAAFLRMWSRQIRAERDFQNVMILLQNLPTQSWGDQQIDELCADAFSLKELFAGSRHHLQYMKRTT